jgi:hypothetical protein
MKKMCPYDTHVGKDWLCKRPDHTRCVFPKNLPKAHTRTPCKCEIIAKKKKMVTVKGWAFIGATTKAVCISSVQPFGVSVPCLATIKAKDWEILKGDK